MNKRAVTNPKCVPVSVGPATIRHFVVDEGEHIIEQLESLVDGIVMGEIPPRHFLLVGPTASGKRALSKAMAAAFATQSQEIDPSGLSREADVESVLSGMGPGSVLLVHNIDELPKPAQVALVRAIVTGRIRERQSKWEEQDGFARMLRRMSEDADEVPATVKLSDFMVIATTNMPEGVCRERHESMVRVTLARCVRGMEAAIGRSLAVRSIAIAPEASELLARMMVVARDDIFEELMALAIASCRSGGTGTLDLDHARRIASAGWSLMPRSRASESIRTAAEADSVPVEELCTRLCVPPSLALNIKKRQIKTPFEELLAQQSESGSQEEES